MKIKVCGMKYNPQEVAALQPDYLGFIFWEPSKRYFGGPMPNLPASIKKVGVFVDADVAEVIQKVKEYHLDAVQLHGKESPEYCAELRPVRFSKPDRSKAPVKIVKVFSIKDDFDFTQLHRYEGVCDYYLFDTKGELPGGNGFAFDWTVLKDYPSTKPFFLSGGIGIEEIESIKEFLPRPESKYCHAIDVNSRFETKPGLKEIEKLKSFIKNLNLSSSP